MIFLLAIVNKNIYVDQNSLFKLNSKIFVQKFEDIVVVFPWLPACFW